MYIAAVILSALLAVFSLAAGAPKAQLKGDAPEGLVAKGLTPGLVRFIGLSEVTAALGLVSGIWWQPLGIAAAVGLVVLLLGAIAYHAKWGDYADSSSRNAAMAPVAFCLISASAACTLAASL
ncbi:DoxX family protein [Streptomyces sp. WSLK1-5]|uniref:DoxX family protein n=1 Tax=unclassified Streptomyces TaxID=2593676 RepID=UPI0037932275